jgi:hypothetical protein
MCTPCVNDVYPLRKRCVPPCVNDVYLNVRLIHRTDPQGF